MLNKTLTFWDGEDDARVTAIPRTIHSNSQAKNETLGVGSIEVIENVKENLNILLYVINKQRSRSEGCLDAIYSKLCSVLQQYT